MTYWILAADDEIELLDALELFLLRDHIGIIKARDGVEAIKYFEQEEPHLVLLDILMPKKDGFEVLRHVRAKSKIPVIMATAKDQDYEKILGLELGADDYISKPYNPLEVTARIKAQLRRYYDYGSSGETEGEEIKRFHLILKLHEGVLEKDGEAVVLTGTELRILELLMRSPGRIFTKQQIFDYAWDDPYMNDDNTIMVHISNLRAKIEENPKVPVMLKTIKGLGYKFEKE